MSKIDQLIKNIIVFVKKTEADEVKELEAAVADFLELKDIPTLVRNTKKSPVNCSDCNAGRLYPRTIRRR